MAGDEVHWPERARVAEFVAPLVLIVDRARVKGGAVNCGGERRHCLAGRIDIAARLPLVLTPAENVGDRAVSDADVPVGLEDRLLPIAGAEARVVDREVERVAREQAVVLRRGAVTVAGALLQTQQHLEVVGRH